MADNKIYDFPPCLLARDWQTKLATITERNKFMLFNSLLSDVIFIVHDTSRDKEITIHAHKYVLCIASPVFYTMFYGAMSSKGAQVIRLPDCDVECFAEFLRYLYCDEVYVSASTVMQLVYLAKKYMVPSLLAKCREMLNDSLTADNVFDVLPSALQLGEDNLVERCWTKIEIDTEQAITSESFTDIDRDLLELLLQREALTIREADLFRAVLSWGKTESERQEVNDREHSSIRDLLGSKVINLIRFPTMTRNEFDNLVVTSAVLEEQEVADMHRFYSCDKSCDVEPPKTFAKIPRGKTFRCNRFSSINVRPDTPAYQCGQNAALVSGWDYGRDEPDCVTFSVTVPIYICGVRMFGSFQATYLVELKMFQKPQAVDKDLLDKANNPGILFLTEGTFAVEDDETDNYYGFEIPVYPPLHLDSKVEIVVEALIQGPGSSYGQKGSVSLDCEGVRFKFSDKRSPNGTSAYHGQFAEIVFKTEM